MRDWSQLGRELSQFTRNPFCILDRFCFAQGMADDFQQIRFGLALLLVLVGQESSGVRTSEWIGFAAFVEPGGGAPIRFGRMADCAQVSDPASRLGLIKLIGELRIAERFAADGPRAAADVAGSRVAIAAGR